MKRILLLSFLALALLLALTGCSSSADTLPSQSPATGNTAAPMLPTNVPQATDNGLLGDLGEKIDETLNGRDGLPAEAQDAAKASRELRDAVQKLTEIDTAAALVTGRTALVGVTYDGSYKGGTDDRLRAMVLDRAQAIVPGVNEVAVTDDATAMREITTLYEALQSGSSLSAVQADADKLAKSLDRYHK